jgi:hypothetical protein
MNGGMHGAPHTQCAQAIHGSVQWALSRDYGIWVFWNEAENNGAFGALCMHGGMCGVHGVHGGMWGAPHTQSTQALHGSVPVALSRGSGVWVYRNGAENRGACMVACAYPIRVRSAHAFLCSIPNSPNTIRIPLVQLGEIGVVTWLASTLCTLFSAPYHNPQIHNSHFMRHWWTLASTLIVRKLFAAHITGP